MLAYFNGHYLDKSQIAISPDDRGFLFGDGVYEVIRTYGGHLFEPALHLERLYYGLRALYITLDGLPDFNEASSALLKKNNLQNSEALIYIQVTRGVAQRSHLFPDPQTPKTVLITVKPYQHDRKSAHVGIRASFVPDLRWSRCDIKSIGGLLANTIAHQKSQDSGASEGLFVRDGYIQEGTHSTVMAVIDGCLVMPQPGGNVLDGVTARVVWSLCQENAISVRFGKISTTNMSQIKELLVCGTTLEVMPVTHIDSYIIGDGICGKITGRLQKLFYDYIKVNID